MGSREGKPLAQAKPACQRQKQDLDWLYWKPKPPTATLPGRWSGSVPAPSRASFGKEGCLLFLRLVVRPSTSWNRVEKEAAPRGLLSKQMQQKPGGSQGGKRLGVGRGPVCGGGPLCCHVMTRHVTPTVKPEARGLCTVPPCSPGASTAAQHFRGADPGPLGSGPAAVGSLLHARRPLCSAGV